MAGRGGVVGRMAPGAIVPSGWAVEEESLAKMTSHPVSLLFTDPHQVHERLTEPAPGAFTHSSSCSENNFHSEKG